MYTEICMELRKLNKQVSTISLEAKTCEDDDSLTLGDLLKDEQDIEDELLSAEDKKAFYKCLCGKNNLKPKELEAIELYLKGYNQHQIAEKMNCSQPTASRYIRIAIVKLKEDLYRGG